MTRTKRLEKAINEIRIRTEKVPEREDYFIFEAANKHQLKISNINLILKK